MSIRDSAPPLIFSEFSKRQSLMRKEFVEDLEAWFSASLSAPPPSVELLLRFLNVVLRI